MSGGGGTHTQTTTQELSPEQRELLKPVIPIAKDFLASPPKQYEGSGIVGFNPLQQQAQQMTLGAAGQIGQGTQQAIGGVQQGAAGLGQTVGQAQNQSSNVFPTLNPTFNYAAGAANQTGQQVQQQMQQGQQATAPGLGFLTGGGALNVNSNPYLQQAIEAASRPAIRQFENVILPGISQDAISAGGFGGTRQQIAQGLAAQGLQQQLGDTAANIASQGYGQGLNAMTQGLNTQVAQQGQNLQAMINSGQLTQQAANQIMQGQIAGFGAQNAANQTAQQGISGQIAANQSLPQMLQNMLMPAQLTSAVGEQQQAMEQAKLTETIQKFVNEQMIPFAAAQDVAALAFGMPGGSSKTTSSGGGGGGAMPWIQGGLGMMSMLPMLFGLSDRRLKDNIRRVGELSDGLPVYRYNFKQAPDYEQIGLMADEVMEKYPFAVLEMPNGVKTVRYDLVPTWEGAECFH